MMVDRSRRRFLRHGLHTAAGAAVIGLWPALAQARDRARVHHVSESPLGPLRAVADPASGLELIALPEGFSCVSLAWTGDAMDDGAPTPPRHDGMAVVGSETVDGTDCWVLVRNHEIFGDDGSFAPAAMSYDPQGPGGTTTVMFDPTARRGISARPSLGGTLFNCAGGPTPWGSWLSCEEKVHGPGDHLWVGQPARFEREHGWVFEVPPDGSDARPLRDMGRFQHEACALGPDGEVYMTEDNGAAGFYRFLPTEPGRLAAGGTLQMLRVAGRQAMTLDVPVGVAMDVDWVAIEAPERVHTERRPDAAGVFQQGAVQGAARFTRLEGCWAGAEGIYFTATDGGRARAGQVWLFRPSDQTLTLVFESPGDHALDNPDNVTVTPGGGLLLCEDGGGASFIRAVDREGRLFSFARNAVRLDGERNDLSGDYRTSEWAGACFSPDGRWLFVNIQEPGITLAITGPWAEAGL